jgi:hypothetical protein
VVVLLPSLVVVPLDSMELVLGAIAAMMWASRCERVAVVDGMVEVFRMGIGLRVQTVVVYEADRRMRTLRPCVPVCVTSDRYCQADRKMSLVDRSRVSRVLRGNPYSQTIGINIRVS